MSEYPSYTVNMENLRFSLARQHGKLVLQYCDFFYNSKIFSCLLCNSGESMENALRACCKGIKIGKILIHRDGDNGKQVIVFYFLEEIICF